MNEDILSKLRKGVENLLNGHVIHQTEELNPTQTGLVQCYLLFEVLDKLEDINTKLAMMKIDIQDVEQALFISREKNNV